ncbi:MAG: hypothetical protein DSZ05_00685 [Sulfurospirillum sp.]|nr:MAG: hypothetical protein DSZ05_00685 [Sulfurospirillum sp.]
MTKDTIGFGIAGNFARHLEQAGESADFVGIETADEDAPKGIFPTYVPHCNTLLGIYPFSSATIAKPQIPGQETPIQMEPEIALLCDMTYENGKVAAIIPTHFGAYNDCSIRIEGAPKISVKKNWGANSKGITAHMTPLDSFSPGGMLDHYALTSFIKRDGILHQYGEDSPLLTYSYFYDKLTDWIVEKLNHQRETGPLEDLSALIEQAGYPAEMLISIGATRYTPYGESHFLEKGDILYIIAYDMRIHTHEAITGMAERDAFHEEGISLLRQTVV